MFLQATLNMAGSKNILTDLKKISRVRCAIAGQEAANYQMVCLSSKLPKAVRMHKLLPHHNKQKYTSSFGHELNSRRHFMK